MRCRIKLLKFEFLINLGSKEKKIPEISRLLVHIKFLEQRNTISLSIKQLGKGRINLNISLRMKMFVIEIVSEDA